MGEDPTVNSHPKTDRLTRSRKGDGESSTASRDERASTPKPPPGPREEERGDTGRPSSSSLPGSHSPSRKREGEPLTASHHGRASTPRPSEGPEREMRRRGDPAGSREMDRLRREVEELKEVIKWERDETEDLREGLTGKCRRREAKIRDLECTIEEMCNSHQRVVEGQAQYIRTVEQRLKQTEELLAARSAELTGTQTFLSTTDRLSEVEVLSIVRDLNENIYQVAVRLTEEWEKLESPPAANLMDVDPTSQPHVPVLVQLVRNRDSSGLTFLLQSYLCSQVTSMSSGWSHHPELAILGSIYEQLSASEEQSISARWRSLTHSYLFRPPLDSALLIEGLARILKCTGSFSSTERSLEFVQTTALEGIVSIARLVVRSEFAFTVEVTSSDMFLLFEPPDSGFNDGSMVSEFGSDGTGAQDKVAGTTEVGVGKSVRGGLDGSRRMEILLKTKVVLEKDLLEGKE